MSKERKSASAKTQQHIEETAYINSVLNTTAHAQVNTVSKTTIEFVRNATKWPEEDILRVLKDSGNDPQLAINKILDGSAGNPTQWTEVQGKRTPKVETKPNKPNKPANGVQNRDGGGKTHKTDEKREDRNQEKREARKRPPRNAPGNNQEQNQQIAQPQGQPQAQPQAEAKHKESEAQTKQGSSQNATTSVPSQTKPTRSSKENGTTSKQSVGGWGKPPASIYTDSHQQPPLPVVNQVSQPPLQTQSVTAETTPAATPSTEKPKQDNLPRWGPQSKSPSISQAPSSTTPQNANASPVSSSPQVQSSESQLEEVQPVQQTTQATTQASKSSPSTAPRQGYHPPSIKAWKPKDAKAPNEQPQTAQTQQIQAVSQPTQAVPTPQVSVPQTQQPQTQPQQSSQVQPPKPTPTTTPTNKPTPVPYTPVVNERSAVILPPSSVALIGGNTHDVHFGVFGSTFTEQTTQTRTESTRTPTTQYQASHATEVSHAHAHPHTDRLGVEHLHIAEAYSPDHQAPQMEDPHANQIPPYFLPPSYIPTFAPQFTYETDPSLRAMHVYDPNQVQGYQPHGLGYQQGIPDSKYGENTYAENKYGTPESSNSTQNPQATQSQGPQTQQPQHPAYYSSPIYGPYPYPPNQYSFQNPSVTPSQYLPPRFYQRPFPANYPGNSAYLQPGAPTGVQPGTTHAYPGAEEQDVYKSPVQFSVPMSSYFMPPEANPSMLGKPSQTSAPKGQSQVNYSQGNPAPQTTEQNQAFKTNQSAYQPGNNPRESYYNMQQPQYGQVQGQSNYAFPVPQVQTQPQVQSSQPFPRGQYQ